jgi:hypothetical protein
VHEIGRTMCVALDQGHAAVCVVTPATRDLLENLLRERRHRCRRHAVPRTIRPSRRS